MPDADLGAHRNQYGCVYRAHLDATDTHSRDLGCFARISEGTPALSAVMHVGREEAGFSDQKVDSHHVYRVASSDRVDKRATSKSQSHQ